VKGEKRKIFPGNERKREKNTLGGIRSPEGSQKKDVPPLKEGRLEEVPDRREKSVDEVQKQKEVRRENST